MADIEGLIAFWFDGWDDRAPKPEDDPTQKRWWSHDPAVDATIRDRFLGDHFTAARRELDTSSASGSVANILLLDQIPRNAFRDTPHMFATDGLAQNATRALLSSEAWEQLPFIHRYFALMPLMHAESLTDHDLATREFSRLADQTAHLARSADYANALDYEHRHRAIIERFGRYPHRNAVLGRSSTPEEATFLEQPGSSF